MKTYRYKYAVESLGEGLEDATEFESMWPQKWPKHIAEDAARYEVFCKDGRGASWPLVFRLWDRTGKELGVFEVEQDTTLFFTAVRIEEQGNAA